MAVVFRAEDSRPVAETKSLAVDLAAGTAALVAAGTAELPTVRLGAVNLAALKPAALYMPQGYGQRITLERGAAVELGQGLAAGLSAQEEAGARSTRRSATRTVSPAGLNSSGCCSSFA